MYIKKTTECCGEIEVVKFNGGMFGNHSERKSKKNCVKTATKVEKHNFTMTAKKLFNLLRENFTAGDLHLTFTYHPNINIDKAQAKIEMRNFLKRLRNYCKKQDIICKYIWNTDVSVRGKIHHHIILPKEISISVLNQLWKAGKVVFNDTLYKNFDYYGLAEYLIDPTHKGELPDTHANGENRYNCSKNLKRPKVEYEKIHANKWNLDPKPPKGYIIKPDSLYNSVDEYSGYPYQIYILIPQKYQNRRI